MKFACYLIAFISASVMSLGRLITSIWEIPLACHYLARKCYQTKKLPSSLSDEELISIVEEYESDK